ncbi:MAG: hypothetical protein ACW990_14375, partial [Promethearchaeota archaeon]
AISLVFNPQRLIRQVEVASKKGDPDIQLTHDPGFKIFRLDDVNSGIEASIHTVDYKIEGYESMEQLVSLTQKFIVNVTMLLPKENLIQTYEEIVNERVNQLNSLLLGTEEYLTTLSHRGEKQRIPEVLDNQSQEIRKYVEETNKKIGIIKEFLDYLEYKERDILIPGIEEVFAKWDDQIGDLGKKLKDLSKKF